MLRCMEHICSYYSQYPISFDVSRGGQFGQVVKAIDLKSIGVTRVSSNLTAVGTFRGCHTHGLCACHDCRSIFL